MTAFVFQGTTTMTSEMRQIRFAGGNLYNGSVETELADRFAPVVRRLPMSAFGAGPLRPELLIEQRRELAVYCAPLE
jgi:hypothetical protein